MDPDDDVEDVARKTELRRTMAADNSPYMSSPGFRTMHAT